jgi:hypothetical protein
MTSRAISASRKDLDISLGHICSLRDEELTSRMATRSRLRLVPSLRRLDCIPDGEPVHGQLVAGTGLARARSLALVRVGVPRGSGDLGKLGTQRIEDRIRKLAEKARDEGGFVEPWAGRARAGLRSLDCHRPLHLHRATRPGPGGSAAVRASSSGLGKEAHVSRPWTWAGGAIASTGVKLSRIR